MANDVITIKCRNCGDEKLFAKYYPTIGSGIYYPESLSEWVELHMKCSPNYGLIDLNGDRCFDLSTRYSG